MQPSTGNCPCFIALSALPGSPELAAIPLLPKKLKENNARKGFFEHEQFVAVRAALPEAIKPIITFAYWTGCRKGEILALRRSQV